MYVFPNGAQQGVPLHSDPVYISPSEQPYQFVDAPTDVEFQDSEVVENDPLSLVEREKDAIIKVLIRNRGLRKEAARDLGISERTLYRKIKEYGLLNDN